MLGRYVAGTLLVLGAAMVMAPPAPERSETTVEVTRAETAPAALDAVSRPAISAPAARLLQTASAAAVAPEAQPAPGPAPGAIEAALMEALELDATETVGHAAPETAVQSGQVADLPADEPSGEAATGILAGLGDPGFFATGDGGRQDESSGSGKLLYVTGSRVNVRSGPSTAYGVVGSVTGGELVELLSYEGADWARIRLNDGDQMGYMSRKFLARELNGG